jgi:tetratricopeptide (TPR) repeat protein
MRTCGLLITLLAASAHAQAPAESAEFRALLLSGRELHEAGRHREARRHFENIMRITRSLGPSREYVALEWLASTYLELRLWSDAQQALIRCLELRDNLWGSRNDGDPNHARILTSLGGLELALHRFTEAELHLNQALKIWRSVPELPKEEFAIYLNNAAMLNCAQNRYSDAAQRLREVIALLQDIVPHADRRLARARSNLGGVLSRLGHHDEADKFSSEALTGFAGKLDQEPMIAAELLSVRANVLRKAKRRREAKAVEALARDYLRKTELPHRIDMSLLGLVAR